MAPQMARPVADGLGQTLGRTAVGSVIPTVGLFLVRLILVSLPMIKHAGPLGDSGLTPLVLIKGVIDTLIYFLILRFTLSTSRIIATLRPQLQDFALLVKLLGLALVATLAYTGYEGLLAQLAPGQAEAYNWMFLILAVAPIVAAIVVVTRRLDFFTSVVFRHLGSGAAGPPAGQPPALAADTLHLEIDQVRQRIDAAASLSERVKKATENMQSRGNLQPEIAESAAKMGTYLAGAQQCLSRQDVAEARRYLDWMDYEAGRVLSAQRS